MLSTDVANLIYDVLVVKAGASECDREYFVHYHNSTRDPSTEFRFVGTLGFGGKFRTEYMGKRLDGSWGGKWYVNQYIEDETEESRKVISEVNEILFFMKKMTEG